MLVLSEPVGGRDNRKLIRRSKAIRTLGGLVVEEGNGRRRHRCMQGVCDRRLYRFVMLGNWAVKQRVAKEPSHALAVHNEWQPSLRIFGIHFWRVIGHVADPLFAVPFDARSLWIPRIAVEVCRGAVVQNAAIEWPAPCPVWEKPHAARVILCDVLHAVAPLG